MMVRAAVVYYSVTGTVSALATHIAEGAADAGAQVRLRSVHDQNSPTGDAEDATLDDLDWADVIALGTPARFGNVASPLKGFLDSTSPLALHGRLADKLVTGFTSASLPNGGQEATLLALYQTMCHWGSVIVPTGYTHPSLRKIGGNPYGLSVTGRENGTLSGHEAEAARFVGHRLVTLAARRSLEPVAAES